MKKFTVITKNGSKWLSLPAPHGVDPIQWHSDNHDLPYIGASEPGTSLSEEQVKEIKQWRNKNISSLTWWDIPDGKDAQWVFVNNTDRLLNSAPSTPTLNRPTSTTKRKCRIRNGLPPNTWRVR